MKTQQSTMKELKAFLNLMQKFHEAGKEAALAWPHDDGNVLGRALNFYPFQQSFDDLMIAETNSLAEFVESIEDEIHRMAQRMFIVHGWDPMNGEETLTIQDADGETLLSLGADDFPKFKAAGLNEYSHEDVFTYAKHLLSAHPFGEYSVLWADEIPENEREIWARETVKTLEKRQEDITDRNIIIYKATGEDYTNAYDTYYSPGSPANTEPVAYWVASKHGAEDVLYFVEQKDKKYYLLSGNQDWLVNSLSEMLDCLKREFTQD